MSGCFGSSAYTADPRCAPTRYIGCVAANPEAKHRLVFMRKASYCVFPRQRIGREEHAEVWAVVPAPDAAAEPAARKKPRLRARTKPSGCKETARQEATPKKAPTRKSAEPKLKSKKTSKQSLLTRA